MENEWQPVRIASFDNYPHCPLSGLDDLRLEIRKNLAGRIVRVKERPLDPRWTCGTKRNFLVLYADAPEYNGTVLLCEHQILAD